MFISTFLTYTFVSTWCVLVCSSRIYLGMHSLADIVVGLILAVLLLFIVLPIGKFLADIFSVFGPFFPFF